MTTTAVIQARLGSTRLPKKILMPLGAKSALEWCIIRTQQAKCVDQIIVACAYEPDQNHKKIIEICERTGAVYHCASYCCPENVLNRVVYISLCYNIDNIIEITSDCPLIDPKIIDKVHDVYVDFEIDYASNAMVRCYPDGADVQVYSRKALLDVYLLVNNKNHKSHVGWNIWQNRHVYSCLRIPAEKELHWPELRLTLDVQEDYELLNKIFWAFPHHEYGPSMLEVVRYLRANPELLEINKNVIGKTPGEG